MAANKALKSFPSVTETKARGGFAIFAARSRPLAKR